MSGSGGFYKYRCKNFYTRSCREWVYVNGTACAECLSLGYDREETEAPTWRGARDVCVPVIQDGVLQYALMELIAPDASGYWTLRAKVTQPPPAPTMGATAELPRPPPLPSPAMVGGPGMMGGRY